jgi:hypothetical protein
MFTPNDLINKIGSISYSGSFNFVFTLALALIFFAYWIHVFFVLYHLIRFGVGKTPKQFALFAMFFSIIFFFLSIFTYAII